jgi:poly-gamma-glutamate synthesis protein (capsule biosynthesis protein)
MKQIRQIIIILLLLILCIFLYFFLKKEDKENIIIETEIKENIKEEYHLTLGMVGDSLYHSGVYKDGIQSDGTYNYDSQLEYITPIVKNYDLAYYNQESILGGTSLGLSTYPRFNSPFEVGDAFVKSGFNLVSLANKHTLDRGKEAILNSVAYWKSKDVVTSGSYDNIADRENIQINEKNNITYAFLSYTESTNGLSIPNNEYYLVNVFDKDKVKDDIEKIRDKVDIVIVAMHWGVEYSNIPNETQKENALYLSNLGVDIIIGTHPHVIQPIEYVNNTLVFYSLGNFISAQDGLNKRIGLIASLDIYKTIDNDNTNITINNIKADLLYTYHDQNYRNFKVIPFYKLNNDYLNNYLDIKTEYEAIINKYDYTIQVGTLG